MLPAEIDENTFLKLVTEVESCRVKRLDDVVKVKIKTPRRLYTFKAEKNEAEGLLKKIKCNIVEL